MIGYQWTVYHESSAHGTDGILASGITDKPEKARMLVEMILAEVEHAVWGLLLRVPMNEGPSYSEADPAADWPPTGEIQVCRRTTNGGFRWGPLYPRERVSV
jgi:hypothetical protein